MRNYPKRSPLNKEEIKERFFATLLCDLAFPVMIAKEIVATFGYQYRDLLAKNRSLGPAAVGLLNGDPQVSTQLLLNGNHYVLAALLDGEVLVDKEAKVILDKWNLTTADQYRLAFLVEDEESAKAILKNPGFTQRSQSAVRRRFPELVVNQYQRREKVVHPKTSTLNATGDLSVWVGRDVTNWTSEIPTKEQWAKSTPARCTNLNVRTIHGYLREALGDGRSSLSKKTWLNFLSLVTDDPDVPFASIIQAARAMAKADSPN
jgi:hypothetical protein